MYNSKNIYLLYSHIGIKRKGYHLVLFPNWRACFRGRTAVPGFTWSLDGYQTIRTLMNFAYSHFASTWLVMGLRYCLKTTWGSNISTQSGISYKLKYRQQTKVQILTLLKWKGLYLVLFIFPKNENVRKLSQQQAQQLWQSLDLSTYRRKQKTNFILAIHAYYSLIARTKRQLRRVYVRRNRFRPKESLNKFDTHF